MADSEKPGITVRPSWHATMVAAVLALAETLQFEVIVGSRYASDHDLNSENPEEREQSTLVIAAHAVVSVATTLLDEHHRVRAMHALPFAPSPNAQASEG